MPPSPAILAFGLPSPLLGRPIHFLRPSLSRPRSALLCRRVVRSPLQMKVRLLRSSTPTPRRSSPQASVPRKKVAASADSGAVAVVTPKPSKSIGVVVLKRGKARLFRGEASSSLVYAGAVAKALPPIGKNALGAADVVSVHDGAGTLLGYGFYNPFSMFAVRVVERAGRSNDRSLPVEGEVQDSALMKEFDVRAAIERRVNAAVQLRRGLGLPCDDTNAFRLVNGEGDGLSGLSCDVFGDVVVIASGALWVERWRSAVEKALVESLAEFEGSAGDDRNIRLLWRSVEDRLKQDGAGDLSVEEAEAVIPSVAKLAASGKRAPAPALDSEDGTVGTTSLASRANDEAALLVENSTVTVRENGVEYVLPASALSRGQKTGMYADQRENRLALRTLLSRRRGARVLDCYCYSGGFGISAALGGASSVFGVDSSDAAITMARTNAALNGVSDRTTFERGDVPAFLAAAAARGDSWDVVVLDPPKLAPSSRAASLNRAASKYRAVNTAALRVVAPGGVLVTCSCSAAMCRDRDLFVATVGKAAKAAGREIVLLQISGAAADHPVEMSEGASGGYLTTMMFAVR